MNEYNQGNGSRGQWTGPLPNSGNQDYRYQQSNSYRGNDYYRDELDYYYRHNNAFDSSPEGKSRGVAALLALFLGSLGVQYFYLGKVTGGILCIILTLCSCGAWQLIILIQGILLLCMNNYDFRRKFVTSNATMPVF